MEHVNIILFENFTALDAFGPGSVFSCSKDLYNVDYFSIDDKSEKISSNLKIITKSISEIIHHDILVIPGGFGTRLLVNDELFVNRLGELARKSRYVLTICTGSALLAKTGLLNDIQATSNKLAWDWVIAQNTRVKWIKNARWISDGKFYSSSGVSAGIDMSLGFVSDMHGTEKAKNISRTLEYVWNEKRDNDPFSLPEN